MKMMNMTGVKQYWHENIMWERTLDFYLQQNAFLKTRLSQVIDAIRSKEFLPQAEQFQNLFIQNDNNLKDMNKDLDKLRRSLETGTYDESRLVQQHNKLSNEVNNFEKNFAALKNEFNLYVIAAKKVS